MIRAEAQSPQPNGIAARALVTAGITSLDKYEAACLAVAVAKSVDEVKEIRDQAEAMRAYAKQAKNKQLEIDASEIRFRAERRIGQLMEAQKDAVGFNGGTAGKGRPKKGGVKSTPPNNKDDRPTLAEAGIDKNLAKRARNYAAVPEEKFEEILAERRDNIEAENKRVTVNLIENANVRGTLGTGENEWYTPDEHLDFALAVLGGIDLDPASTEEANSRVKAARFISRAEDGLAQEWFGKVWLNPPYAQPFIAQFADKMVEEWGKGIVEAAIVLTHNYTDTAWFQKLAGSAAAICFTRGRIRFVSPTGELAAPTQGQAFFYFGHDVDAFAKVFSEVGFVAEVRQ